MQTAPKGAVIKIDITANVKASLPHFNHLSSSQWKSNEDFTNFSSNVIPLFPKQLVSHPDEAKEKKEENIRRGVLIYFSK